MSCRFAVLFHVLLGNKETLSVVEMTIPSTQFECLADLLYIAIIQIQRGAVCIRDDKNKGKDKTRVGICPANQMLYMETFEGQSWTFIMKHIARTDIVLNNYITYLDELILECCNSVCGLHSMHSINVLRYYATPKSIP